jgi:[acyl-carrier-protein] S-malonyltransferase
MPAAMTALLFPGQGSQEQGLGRDLAERDKEAMGLWKKAERISSLALREIYWEGDEASMADTRALQPALTVVNLNLWGLLSGKLSPACAAGHSLGEYSALAAAGALPVDAVLELTALRGRLMAEADPEGKGAMAAILKLDRAGAEQAVAEVKQQGGDLLLIANYNTPGQFVASGAKEAIAVLQEKVKALRGRALPLPVSGAFHSPLMEEASKELARALNKVSWSRARFPVYANVTGAPALEADELKALVLRQMTSAVRWSDTVLNQWKNGVRRFVECGPKGALSRMVKPNLDSLPEAPVPESWQSLSVGNLAQAESFA